MNKGIIIFLFSIVSVNLFIYESCFSQENITVSGKVIDAENSALSFPILMIVNLSTQHGIFGNTDGTFTTAIKKNDTLLISATGYTMKKVCFNDSVSKSNYQISILLNKLKQDLKEVEIFPERDINKIESDIQKLGYDEKDYRLTGIDAWSAPLTALYQEFSAKEKDKRRAAQLRNEDRKRELLKELLRLYKKNNLVDLSPEKFDVFIDYLSIPDEMFKSWTQYELAMYVKSKYERFTSHK